MPYPPSLTVKTVRCSFAKAGEEIPQGQVRFAVPSRIFLQSSVDDTLVPPFTEIAVLDAVGDIEIDLPPNDDPDWIPQGWSYEVTLEIDGRLGKGSLSIPFDAVGDIELADHFNPATPETGSLFIPLSQLGSPNGVATLDGDGTLAIGQVPEHLTEASLDTTYVAQDTLGEPGFPATLGIDGKLDADQLPNYLAQPTLDARYVESIEVAVANGVASLDATGDLVASQIPPGVLPIEFRVNGVGDGVADDTAAVQAAADAMTSASANVLRGGKMVFGKGKFRITSTIFLSRVCAEVAGQGWSDFTTGYLTASQGTVLMWDGNNTSPMFQVQGSRGVRFDSIAFVGNADPAKRPTAAVRMFVAAGDAWKNGMAHFNRCSFGRLGGAGGLSGIVMGAGVLWDGSSNTQNDTSWTTNCRFQGCQQGYRTADTQNVLHHIEGTYFWDNEIGIDTSSQMSLTNCYFTGSTIRDLDVKAGARVNIREFASELSAQFARLRSGSQIMVDGGYWQISNNVQLDRFVIDAIDDSRAVVRLKDFQWTRFTGYVGGVPLIAAKGATNSADANKVIDLDNVRWLAANGLGIDETFLDVTPTGDLNTITVSGNILPAAPTLSAGRQRFFFNQITTFQPSVDFQRDDRLSNEELRKTAGEYTGARNLLSLPGGDMASGTLYLTYFTAKRSETIATLTAYTAQVAAATPTLIRYAVFSVAANGNITLISSTPNDTALMAVNFAEVPKALSVPWDKVKGHRYAVGALVISGATMPRLFTGHPYNGASILDTLMSEEPRLTGAVSGLADLPTLGGVIAAGSIGLANRRAPFMRMS